VLETERYRIVGDVTLPAEAEEQPFIAVAREHIQLAYEDRD
jgi:hypothetical protein